MVTRRLAAGRRTENWLRADLSAFDGPHARKAKRRSKRRDAAEED